MYNAVNEGKIGDLVAEEREVEPDKSLVEFSTTAVAVMEDVGTVDVSIMRFGKVSNEVSIKVDTIDGSADEGRVGHRIFLLR